MTTIKVMNQGKSAIIHEYGVLHAGKAQELESELAHKLRRMYPDKVVSFDDLVVDFKGVKTDKPEKKAKKSKKTTEQKDEVKTESED